MHGRELRMGNYLQSLNGHLVRVTKIEKEQVGVEGKTLGAHVTTTYDYLKPVGLTPAILEKNGFKLWELEENHPLYFHEKLVTSLYLEFSHPDTYSLCLVNEEGQFIDLLVSFKYVHELQNILFALTGYEMEFFLEEEAEEENS